MVIVVQNNEISRVNPTLITITLSELFSDLTPNLTGRFSNLSNWKTVTINYQSSVYKEQTKQLSFEVIDGVDVYELTETLSPYFISDLKVQSVTIMDGENGYIKILRGDLNISTYDIGSDALPAPVSEVISSSDRISGFVSLEEVGDWEVGFVVRMFNPVSGKYLTTVSTITSVNPTTGQFELSNEIDVLREMVIKSANGTKYVVTISNEGILHTERDDLAEETGRYKFNIDESESVFYVLGVSDSGVLFIDVATLDDIDLPILNNHLLSSDNNIFWRIGVDVNEKAYTESVVNTLEGLELRFAFSNEVTIDQLKRFKFD